MFIELPTSKNGTSKVTVPVNRITAVYNDKDESHCWIDIDGQLKPFVITIPYTAMIQYLDFHGKVLTATPTTLHRFGVPHDIVKKLADEN